MTSTKSTLATTTPRRSRSALRTDIMPADVTPDTTKATPAKPTTKATPAKPTTKATPAKPTTKATPAKPTKTVTPAKPTKTVTPEVAALENTAGQLLEAAVTDSTKLAHTVAKLYTLKPWTMRGKSVKAYFGALGIKSDNYIMPTVARRALVSLVYRGDKDMGLAANPSAPVEDVAFMSAATTRTIARDRDFLGLANVNRQDGQKSTKPTATAVDTTTKAAPNGTVPAAGVVHKVISLVDMINAMTDPNEVRNIITMCEERLEELSKAAPATKATVKATPATKATVKATPATKATVKATPATKATVKATPATKATVKATPATNATVKATPALVTLPSATEIRNMTKIELVHAAELFGATDIRRSMTRDAMQTALIRDYAAA